MPIDYSIDAPSRCATVIGTGTTSYDEAEATALRMTSDPRYRPEFAILFDGTGLDNTASFEDALRYRDLFGRLRQHYQGPIAVVVSGSGVNYGVGRMIASLTQLVGVRMEVFHDTAAARAWIEKELRAG
jgi:hypothetical protein